MSWGTSLWDGAAWGQSGVVARHLASGASPDCTDNYGLSALAVAAREGNAECVRLLLDAGANTETDTNNPLRIAAGKGHVDCVRLLLEAGANVEGSDDRTPLHEAANYDQLECMGFLLAAGANVNAVDRNGNTILQSIIHYSRRRLDAFRILLEWGADPSIRNKDGKLPIDIADSEEIKALLRSPPPSRSRHSSFSHLREAADAGDGEEVRRLVAAGANVEEKSVQGYTALHRAATNGHCECVQLLLAAGANINAAGQGGHTPLHLAARYGHAECVRLLIEAGGNVNSLTRRNGWSPLHYVSGSRNEECMRLLLEAGGEVNARNIEGVTPLHLIASVGHAGCVRLLLRAGGDVRVANAIGSSSLHFAAMSGDVECVSVLLDAGIDVNILDRGGCTPLHEAAKCNKVEVVRFLLERGANPSIQNKNEKLAVDEEAVSEEIKTLLRSPGKLNSEFRTRVSELENILKEERKESLRQRQQFEARLREEQSIRKLHKEDSRKLRQEFDAILKAERASREKEREETQRQLESSLREQQARFEAERKALQEKADRFEVQKQSQILQEELETANRKHDESDKIHQETLTKIFESAKSSESHAIDARQFASIARQVAETADGDLRRVAEEAAKELEEGVLEGAKVLSEVAEKEKEELSGVGAKEKEELSGVGAKEKEELSETAAKKQMELVALVDSLKKELRAEKERASASKREGMAEVTSVVHSASRRHGEDIVTLDWNVHRVAFRRSKLPRCLLKEAERENWLEWVDESEATPKSLLGKSRFEVHAGMWEGRPAAIKVIAETSVSVDKRVRKQALQEMKTHKTVSLHEHVVSLHGAVFNPDHRPLAVVMQECGAVVVLPHSVLFARDDVDVEVLRMALDPRSSGGTLGDFGVDGDFELLPAIGLAAHPLEKDVRFLDGEELVHESHSTRERRIRAAVVRSVGDLLGTVNDEADKMLEEMEDVEGASSDSGVISSLLKMAQAGDAVGLSRNLQWALLPFRRRVFLALGAARGLAYLHEKRIVHRDVKPDNLMLGNAGSGWTVMLGDFGDAKKATEETLSMATGGGAGPRMHGTSVCMSPEALGGSEVSEASDVYSLGCVLALLLTPSMRTVWDGHPDVRPGVSSDDQLRSIQAVSAAGGHPTWFERVYTDSLPGPERCTQIDRDHPDTDPTPAAEYVRLVKRCLHPDPSFRPSSSEIVHRLQAIDEEASKLQ